MPDEKLNRDLLLSPDTFLFMQNEGKNGMISVSVGPGVVNQTGQDKPVIYDQKLKVYKPAINLEQAVQQFPRAEEGDYLILENPAEQQDKFPTESVQQATKLVKGRKVIIPGPWSNALWPGQSAKVIPGHRLRSNQYLVVTIYNEEEARKNWSSAIVKPAESTGENPKPDALKAQPKTFVVGQRIIIKGTEVSFYIPPTGVEVTTDENNKYVREAVTLEQLEYSILIDENGTKRYPRGPEVVFPEPTEQFLPDDKGNRKFKALELNDIQGIHVKVIQAYEEGGRKYEEGEELFITGKDTPEGKGTAIYFPREEHSVIEYGEGNSKHYSTAVPEGEGRYVMNRSTGEIETITGPIMLLPDPRNRVMVRRVLSDKQCELWYPGNAEALNYNRNLRTMMANTPSARSGFVSEGDYRKQTRALYAASASAGFESADYAAGDELVAAGGTNMPTKFTRGTVYTPPRQITLDTKYDGVPSINVYTGYAVLIVSKTGKRRVEVGPATVLLNYDETLEVLTFSTGKPKNTDTLQKSVYLRVKNNNISDIITVETSDHVKATVKISLCVQFEGDENKWFEVENYVKFLTDHVRSILKGAIKQQSVENFYANYLPIIRDSILGKKPDTGVRNGLAFPENGMKVTDVEVLSVDLANDQIAQMLNGAQYEVVKQNIGLHQARKTLEVTKEHNRIQTETAEAAAATRQRELELAAEQVKQELQVELAKIEAQLLTLEERRKTTESEQALMDIKHNADLTRVQSKADLEQKVATEKQQLAQKTLEAETKAAVERLTAAKENISEALVALGREDVMVKMAEALRIETFISGNTMEGAASRLIAGFPILQQVFDRARGAGNGNGSGNRVAAAQARQ